MRMLASAVTFATIAAAASPLAAQVCSGSGSIGDAGLQVSGGVAGYTYARAMYVAAAAARGANNGTVKLRRVHDGDLALSAYELEVEAVREVREGRGPFLCPLIAVGLSIMPGDPVVFGGSEQRVTAAIGGAFAALMRPHRVLAINPAAGVRVVGLLVRRPYYGGSAGSGSHYDRDVFALVSGGFGIVILDRVTIRPGVTIPMGLQPIQGQTYEFAVPFGRENREVSGDLTVSIPLGRRGPAAR